MAESEREFHEETTMVTPGIDLGSMKGIDDVVGKNKVRTTVFGDF